MALAGPSREGDGDAPPAGAPMLALSLPLFISAGAVNGIAVALAQSGEDLFYLVDNATIDGPPLWVHEAAVERCRIAPLRGGLDR
jgi:hypothetical protein